MAFDGITIYALVQELNQKLCNGHIEKIFQPENDELNINIRNNKENYTLLLSSNANNPRVYITKDTKANPQNAPTFSMLMRKNLTRGKILSIKQPLMERIIEIEIATYNELGDQVNKTLTIELMGRHSNIILINKETNKVIDSIKRVGSNLSRYRQVLPGNEYIYPPNHDKLNPLLMDYSKVESILKEYPKNKKIESFFVNTFNGISPLIARELCFISNVFDDQSIESLSELEKNTLILSFLTMIQKIKNTDFTPNIIYSERDGRLIDFSVIPLKQYSQLSIKNFDSISILLENYYKERDKLNRVKQKSSSLTNFIKNRLEKNYKKIVKQKEEYKKSIDASIYKLYGELITANIYSLRGKDNKVILTNFYSDSQEKIEIPLNPNLTPIENAQKYFKKYSKSKNAIKQLSKQISSTEDEIFYLEGQLENIKNSTEIYEIEEIKTELRQEGYLSLKYKNKGSKTNKLPSSIPLHFISSEGLNIYVGKNNKQNDILTLKSSSNDDIWLHAKGIPGSHVIIKNNNSEITNKTLTEAGILASYYSKARYSENVAVDYTKVKNVKKPKGAKPGMVIYDDYQTLFVTPSEAIIYNLKRC